MDVILPGWGLDFLPFFWKGKKYPDHHVIPPQERRTSLSKYGKNLKSAIKKWKKLK